MKFPLSIAFSLLAITASFGDWKQELSPASVGIFAPPRPAHLAYKFGWSAIPAAEGIFDFSQPKPGQVRLDSTVKTIGAVRGMFRLDAQQTALSSSALWQPISMRQTEVYNDETISTKLDFDKKGVVRIRSSNVPGPGNAKAKRFDFVPVYDLHSAYLWMRSQSLHAGSAYRFVVYASAAPFLAEAHVLAHETIKVAGQTYPAIKLDLNLRHISKKHTIEKYGKLKRAVAWISDDADRLLIKIEAEIFVGSVWVELQSATFLPPGR